MENNLDDILIDPLEGKQKNPKRSKRWILISLAFGLLIVVAVLVLYFVLAKKEKEAQGLEAVHSELERFESLVQKQSVESQKDDEFDKLIAEIKAKHQGASDQKTTPTAPEASQKPSTPISEPTQTSNDPAMDLIKTLQKTQGMNENQSDSKPQSQASQNKKPEQSTKPQQEIPASPTPREQTPPKQNVADFSVAKAFDSLEVPRGFYLQVGVFEKKPNMGFLAKLSDFSYHVEKMNSKGKIVNRYLIGPFKTRKEAEFRLQEVAQKVTRPMIVELPQ